jgi:hypothetical protein
MQRVIKRSSVDWIGPGATPASKATAERRAPARAVRLLRLDGRVYAIEFTCACGQVSVLELEYGERAPGPELESPPTSKP